MLLNMKMQQTKTTPLFCDNQGVLKLAKNPVFHERTKHVKIHCHFIKQLVKDGSIEIQCCLTNDQTVDIFTKSLDLNKYAIFWDKLGVGSKLTIKGGC